MTWPTAGKRKLLTHDLKGCFVQTGLYGQRNSEVRGLFLKNNNRRDSALQHREKHHSSNDPKSKEKKPVPFLQQQSEAAILAQHDTCHCQLRKVLDDFQYYFKPKPTLYVLSRHAQIFRFLPPLVNRSWKDWDNYFI